MVTLDRRAWLLGAASTSTAPSTLPNTRCFRSLDQALDVICRDTPRDFRQAVAATSQQGGACRFLYRGEEWRHENDACVARILSPQPDLLDVDTYQDEAAVKYFDRLDKQLTARHVPARPSMGHIGTASIRDAAQWGMPVSIWPLGDALSYVWPVQRRLFYPFDQADDSITSDLAIDRDLTTALLEDKEVLFASWFNESTKYGANNFGVSSFVAVPSRYDEELRRGLSRRNYGLGEPW